MIKSNICVYTWQCERIIIMISFIMMIQLYHIVWITDNRPNKLSDHLKIWYLDNKKYHIISNVIFKFLKFITSFQTWYLNFKNYPIISYQNDHIKMIFQYSKFSFQIKINIEISQLNILLIKTKLLNYLKNCCLEVTKALFLSSPTKKGI